MNPAEFKDLPDDAKLWAFGFEQVLDEAGHRIISERMESFVGVWHTHKVPVHGSFVIVDGRFVLVAGFAPEDISGCSIDSCVENFKFFKEAYGIDGLNRGLVYFRNENSEIEALDRVAFQEAVSAGRVASNTVVFDLTIRSLGELRAGKFETTFGDCWHARAFSPSPTEAKGQTG